MLDLLRQSGIEAKKVSSTKGGEYHSACPKCGGDDRFHVWPEQNAGAGSFWCRGCGLGGDRIEFLRKFRGMSFRQAAAACGKELKPRPNHIQPYRPAAAVSAAGTPMFTPITRPAPATLWQAKCGTLVKRCQEMLWMDYPKVRAWLKARGITEAAARAAGLGWNPGQDGRDLYRERKAWGAPEALKANGTPKKLWMPVGLVIPWFAADGSLLRVRIRRDADDNLPRYVVIPGSSAAIMSIHPERKAQVVVESELDAIMLSARTSAGAVALGSVSMKPDTATHAALKNALQILLALDFDRAGCKAVDWWLQNYPRCDRWPVPVGKDPGEAYAQGCDLAAWVHAGLPPALQITAGKKISVPGIKSAAGQTMLRPASQGPEAEAPAPPPARADLNPQTTSAAPLSRADSLELFISAIRYV